MPKTKISPKTRVKMIVAKIDDLAELGEIRQAVEARRKVLRERQIAESCEAALKRMEAAREASGGKPVKMMIDPNRVAVSSTGIPSGVPVWLREIHRGRKHVGCWFTTTDEPRPARSNWVWFKPWDCCYVVDFVESDPSAIASAVSMMKMAKTVFGAVP